MRSGHDAPFDLVLWRSGITCFFTFLDLKKGEKPTTADMWRKTAVTKKALQAFELRDRFGYYLYEHPKDDRARWALYTFTAGKKGDVAMAIYFDRQQDLEIAKKIWLSLTETPS